MPCAHFETREPFPRQLGQQTRIAMPATPPPSPETGALVGRIFPKLRRFFANKTNADEAQDLAQSTIVDFIAKVTLVEIEHPEAYIFKIAHNKLKQHYGRRLGAAFDSQQVSLQQVATTLGTRLDRSGRINDALQSLPLDHQEAIELRYGEGLKLEEVAAALGRSVPTVKRYIRSGLETMRDHLVVRDGDEDLGLQVGAEYRRG